MIPQNYPIEEGKLYGGEYPGHRNPEVAKIRLRHLVALGMRTFVDLTAPADRMDNHTVLWFTFNRFDRYDTTPVKTRIRPQITISGHKVEPFSIAPKPMGPMKDLSQANRTSPRCGGGNTVPVRGQFLMPRVMPGDFVKSGICLPPLL
jgi:hypothetical protein